MADLNLIRRAIAEERLAYLLLLQMRGYQVRSAELARLRQELRGDASPPPLGSHAAIQEAVTELQNVLALVDGYEEAKRRAIKVTLFRRGPIKLRMRPEHNHSRAHFHLEYKREHSASYAVDTLECLAGYIPRKHEDIALSWARQRKPDLKRAWQDLNSGDDIEWFGTDIEV